MGVCASCLGRRGNDAYDEGDENRLLYDDGNGMQYGSFGDPAMGGDDTLEAQREAEALQRVVARTSNNMVDVFEIAPHDKLSRTGASQAPFGYASQGAQVARYQHLVSRLHSSGHDNADQSSPLRVDWLTDGDDDESIAAADLRTEPPPSVKALSGANGSATLVGTFADAAAAMQ